MAFISPRQSLHDLFDGPRVQRLDQLLQGGQVLHVVLGLVQLLRQRVFDALELSQQTRLAVVGLLGESGQRRLHGLEVLGPRQLDQQGGLLHHPPPVDQLRARALVDGLFLLELVLLELFLEVLQPVLEQVLEVQGPLLVVVEGLDGALVHPAPVPVGPQRVQVVLDFVGEGGRQVRELLPLLHVALAPLLGLHLLDQRLEHARQHDAQLLQRVGGHLPEDDVRVQVVGVDGASLDQPQEENGLRHQRLLLPAGQTEVVFGERGLLPPARLPALVVEEQAIGALALEEFPDPVDVLLGFEQVLHRKLLGFDVQRVVDDVDHPLEPLRLEYLQSHLYDFGGKFKAV
jgi:hypothetical protein